MVFSELAFSESTVPGTLRRHRPQCVADRDGKLCVTSILLLLCLRGPRRVGVPRSTGIIRCTHFRVLLISFKPRESYCSIVKSEGRGTRDGAAKTSTEIRHLCLLRVYRLGDAEKHHPQCIADRDGRLSATS